MQLLELLCHLREASTGKHDTCGPSSKLIWVCVSDPATVLCFGSLRILIEECSGGSSRRTKVDAKCVANERVDVRTAIAIGIKEIISLTKLKLLDRHAGHSINAVNEFQTEQAQQGLTDFMEVLELSYAAQSVSQLT